MTLRLVSDNEAPTGPDYTDVPAMLRQYAAEIEAGQYGDVEIGLLVLLAGPDTLVLGCGDDPASPYEMMGIFEAAKLRTLADVEVEE